MKQLSFILLTCVLYTSIFPMETTKTPLDSDFIQVVATAGEEQTTPLQTTHLLKNLAFNLNQTWGSVTKIFATASEQIPAPTETWENVVDVFDPRKDEQEQTLIHQITRYLWKKTRHAKQELAGLESIEQRDISSKVYEEFTHALEHEDNSIDAHLMQKILTRMQATTVIAIDLLPKLNKFNKIESPSAQNISEIGPAVDKLETLLTFNGQYTVTRNIETHAKRAIVIAKKKMLVYHQSHMHTLR